MRVLITGNCGFIGTNLTIRCIKEGWSVHGVDNNEKHIDKAPNDVKLVTKYSDFADDSFLALIKDQQFDVIFHQAAVPRVSYSVEHPVETTDENLFKTVKLLEAAAGNCRRLLFASSSSVYGDVESLPIKEEHSIGSCPKSPYALQKKQCESFIRLFCELYGLDAVCLRYFNVFGPYQYGDSSYATALSAWCHNTKNGLPLRSDGDGTQSRDLCFIDNVVEANILAAKANRSLKGEAINIACGDRTTNNEILNHFKKRFPEVIIEHAPFRAGDIMHTQANVKKAKQLIGYRPLIKFWDGLLRTLQWWNL